jgi:hypothetical protein
MRIAGADNTNDERRATAVARCRSSWSARVWHRALPVALLCALLGTFAGCATVGPPPTIWENPALVPVVDRDYVWDQIVDVVDNYFQIDREDRVRQVGDVLTVGRIDTAPEIGATLLEPWRSDSVNFYERLESTFQTIRRRALVQVVPAEGGFLVDVAVYKELENLKAPEMAATGRAVIRDDASPAYLNDESGNPNSARTPPPPASRASGPYMPQPTVLTPIPLGRDTALEQRIIAELMARLGAVGPHVVPTRLPQPY